MFHKVDGLVLTPSKLDREAEEGAAGDAMVAFPALPCHLDLSLTRDLENHGLGNTLLWSCIKGTVPWGWGEIWACATPSQLVP